MISFTWATYLFKDVLSWKMSTEYLWVLTVAMLTHGNQGFSVASDACLCSHSSLCIEPYLNNPHASYKTHYIQKEMYVWIRFLWLKGDTDRDLDTWYHSRLWYGSCLLHRVCRWRQIMFHCSSLSPHTDGDSPVCCRLLWSRQTGEWWQLKGH